MTQPGLRLLSYLALLPASATELDAVVERAVATNPLLERLPWYACATCGLASAAPRCPACASSHWATEPPSTVDWREDLLRDAALELSHRFRPLLTIVVADLDEHGLLRHPPDADPAVLDVVIDALRLVGPPGIAATSATDCVLVQARQLVAAGAVPALVSEIADRWLHEVAEERYAEISTSTGAAESDVVAAVALLRERTRPFVALPGRAPRSAPTDVVFTLPDPGGPIVAHVADLASVGLGRVSDPLPDSAEARAWAAPHREAADRLFTAVAARSRIVQQVADQLAARQRGFLVGGSAAHVTLRRAELAEALSVHPSTVGRAVAGKVARCPNGRIVPLADFFGARLSTAARVSAALAAHPGATDREIAAWLSRHGGRIARRTVAKYRALLPKLASPLA